MDTPGEGKALAWTEEAKFQFLLRIVAQLKEDGKSINWQRLNMPGRTTKSLQNMWTKINKAVADLEECDGVTASPPKTPNKRGTGATRKTPTKKSVSAEDDEDDKDNLGSPKRTAKKRPAPSKATPSKSKKMKKEPDSDEEDDSGDSIEAKPEPEE